MTTINRRNLFKRLLAVPVVAWFAGRHLLGASEPEAPPGGDARAKRSKDIAIRTLRFINTLESRSKISEGHFCTLSELADSKILNDSLDDAELERHRIGGTFYRILRLSDEEIAPGWLLKMHITQDRKHYRVLLVPKDGRLGFAFATDERGVIYEGEVAQSYQLASARGPQDLLASGRPIGSPRRTGLGHVREILASFSTTPFLSYVSDCGDDHMCGCIFCSDTACGGPNCGCVACIWCCKHYTT